MWEMNFEKDKRYLEVGGKSACWSHIRHVGATQDYAALYFLAVISHLFSLCHWA